MWVTRVPLEIFQVANIVTADPEDLLALDIVVEMVEIVYEVSREIREVKIP